jgi:hypothetical protein
MESPLKSDRNVRIAGPRALRRSNCAIQFGLSAHAQQVVCRESFRQLGFVITPSLKATSRIVRRVFSAIRHRAASS